MKSLLKRIYFDVLPPRLRRGIRPLIHPLLTAVEREVGSHTGAEVISGPFRGMKVNQRRKKPLAFPLLLGTYEMELHEVFSRLEERSFSTIIDLGAAEGYYAVGLLLWKKEAHLIAFEANPEFHDSIRLLAEENGVEERIEIRGACDKVSLKEFGEDLDGCLLIVDVEGYEKELLDPEEIPRLLTATILVEVHDNFVAGCTEAITGRFESSHLLTRYSSRPRVVTDYPISTGLRKVPLMRRAIEQTISDGRTFANSWILLSPKRS